MAFVVLHLISIACGILCAEHVRGSRGGELPQMQSKSRARGAGTTCCKKSEKVGKKTQKYEKASWSQCVKCQSFVRWFVLCVH